ncbi:uncharacterized protein C8Q71DRAFT_682287, partial [Rhodofomes roseus]
ILNTAKKYNVSFAAIKLDRRVKLALPIWYHLGATKHLRRLNNNPSGACLRDTHGVTYVADLLKLTRRPCLLAALTMSNDFVPRDCTCQACEDDRAAGCRAPTRCCKAAVTLLDQVRPKWNPELDRTPDGLTLTKRRMSANKRARQEKGPTTFNPSITERGEVDEAFRVFV